MDIIKNMRIKYMLTTTLIAAIFLLTLFAGFFGLLCASDEAFVARALENAFDSLNNTNSTFPNMQCIIICEHDNGDIITNSYLDYYQNLSTDIVNAAISKGDGRFHVGKFYFVVESKRIDDVMAYAVFDRTSIRNGLIDTSFIVAMLYICALALVALLAYLFSSKTLNPVEDAFTKQRDFVANASHELKTPLTIISTNLSVIKSEPNSSVADNEKWISSIDAQVSRMNGLIHNILELSKLEQSVLPKEDINFSEITEGACLAFDAVCFERNAKLITDIQKNIFVYGDKNSLERLVLILLDNAIKYCGKMGKIGCRLDADQKRLHLTIMNTGEAISEEDAKHVFDRFYRTDGARQNPDNQSFGLGLSIAAATVSAHNGTISCHGIENKGTVFDLYLPLVKKTATSADKTSKKCKSFQHYNNFDKDNETSSQSSSQNCTDHPNSKDRKI